MLNVDFETSKPQLLCHEQYLPIKEKILEDLAPYNLQDHFILFSSGTTGGDLKGYALSKKALFTNAKAVNDHFGLTKNDVWGLSLPTYHVGGLSVLARAHLLQNKVIDARKWDPEKWVQKIQDVTITTVVPTQLYDLVKRTLKPPAKLKYVVVGGDLLSTALKDEALKLGWPVIRTFGMSEVCSQLASAKTPQSDDLEVLPIHEINIQDERLLVKSQALFTLEFTFGETLQVKSARELSRGDFYVTKDRAQFDGLHFKHLGRIGDEFKIAGHLVNFMELRNKLSSYLVRRNLFNQVEISLKEDERKGKKLVLLTVTDLDEKTREEIQDLFLPVKIDEIQKVVDFQRTDLGKLKKTF